MKHSSIVISRLSYSFFHKVCFEDVNAQIHCGKRIAILGPNGSGKSTFLKIIQGLVEPTAGSVIIPDQVIFGYVPQVIESFSWLSGGQRFQRLLTTVLSSNPNILCLDEPTNHLDVRHRRLLMQLLNRYAGTLLIVSHDVELLSSLSFDEFWHIEDSAIQQFSGSYDSYCIQRESLKQRHIKSVELLRREQKKIRNALEIEYKREACSKRAGRNEHDKMLRKKMCETATATVGKKRGHLYQAQEQVNRALSESRLPEEIKVKFKLNSVDLKSSPIIVITNGACGYSSRVVIHDVQLQVGATERVVIRGDNGSGKSTFLKAILSDSMITRTGDWQVPDDNVIGYLDQHYCTLNSALSVFETIAQATLGSTTQDIRKLLNDFLFRKNEEVQALVNMLSGGERVRLLLAKIAAQSPHLLILDEVTNNVDQQTREHIIRVLNAYPGAIIVVSHDQDFLEQIRVNSFYRVADGRFLHE